MAGFDDLDLALRMRDTIARLVREEVDRYRPPEQYGRVIDVNRTSLNASVLLNGDVEPIKVKMSSQIQPLETDILNGAGAGCMVLVGGNSGNYWIKDIISGHAYSAGLAVASQKTYGGVGGDLNIATHRVIEALMPALGSVYHIGRWDNNLSNVQDGRGYFWISIRQDLFSSLFKVYEIPVKVNGTNAVWQKLPATVDHGDYSGHDFELEIMSDTTGVELRIRRTKDGGGFTPGGYTVSVWAHMDGQAYDDASVGESIPSVPTRVYGTTTVGEDLGPFISPGLNYNNRSQFNLIGGGLVKMDTTTNFLSWSERFIVLGHARNHILPAGFYDITQPTNGSLIPVYGSALATSVNATAAGVPLQSSQTLYYELPYGDSATASVNTNFRIVAHDDATQIFEVPSHWIMIATRAISLSQTGDCRLGTGQQLNGPVWDTWTPQIQNAGGSPTNGNSTVTGRYRKDGRTVHFMMTFVKGSTSSFGSGNIWFTLPVSARSMDPEQIGYGLGVQAVGSRFICVAGLSTVDRFGLVGTNGAIFTNAAPAAWATGDEIRVSGTYEAAGP